jgi:hypothetical protein
LEGPCQNFPDVLLEQLAVGSEFEKVKGDKSIYSVLVSFRDLCSLLWMLHARDKLSESLRKREKFLGNMGYDSQHEKVRRYFLKYILTAATNFLCSVIFF